jgi:hypothetical protein
MVGGISLIVNNANPMYSKDSWTSLGDIKDNLGLTKGGLRKT